MTQKMIFSHFDIIYSKNGIQTWLQFTLKHVLFHRKGMYVFLFYICKNANGLWVQLILKDCNMIWNGKTCLIKDIYIQCVLVIFLTHISSLKNIIFKFTFYPLNGFTNKKKTTTYTSFWKIMNALSDFSNS